MIPNSKLILDDIFGWEISEKEGTPRTPVDLGESLGVILGSPFVSRSGEGATEPAKPTYRKLLTAWERSVIETAKENGELLCRKARWPKAAPFALFLSHDIDQIHDRELFRWLGDINHLKRHWRHGERCNSKACLKRILRPLFRPADPYDQFAAIRRIEGRHGWASTFFLLEDTYWARMGGRFNWIDPSFERISKYLLDEGCELGIHGSAYSHDNPQWWKAITSRFASLYGRPAIGARNHYLKLKVPQTWECQREAGLLYDTTFGYPNQLGAPGDFCYPFQVPSQQGNSPGAFVELPLSVMDQTLFRYLNLEGDAAFAKSRDYLSQIIEAGGLAVLLWHNNFFHEEEYQEWEQTYDQLLSWLALQDPWAACGRDIAAWWVGRGSARLATEEAGVGGKSWQITCEQAVDNLAVEIFGTRTGDLIESNVAFQETRKELGHSVVIFPHLDAGAAVSFRVKKAPGHNRLSL